MSERLAQLSEAGVSIWLDDLSRERLETGNLADLVKNSHVVGVTTNPSIFQKALADGERYDAQVREVAKDHAEVTDSLVSEAVLALTTTDVRDACDIMKPVFDASDGVDGRVSIEVTPDVAHDTGATLHQAKQLWELVDRENAYVKIPAIDESIPAITAALAEGININVTLIFGLGVYREVMEAYVAGLEQARDHGHDLAKIHSVASFFVSRVDTEIDKRLEDVAGGEELRGKAGVANARLAYKAYEEFFTGPRWEQLEALGARRQRPLWASTGVKNPDYPDTMYVDDLVVENTVNTMPEKTLEAVADHGNIDGDQVRPHYADAESVMRRLADAGISYDDVISTLETEGVDKFVTAWDELVQTLRAQLEQALEDTRAGDEAGAGQ